jgi:hypothetical protein
MDPSFNIISVKDSVRNIITSNESIIDANIQFIKLNKKSLYIMQSNFNKKKVNHLLKILYYNSNHNSLKQIDTNKYVFTFSVSVKLFNLTI